MKVDVQRLAPLGPDQQPIETVLADFERSALEADKPEPKLPPGEVPRELTPHFLRHGIPFDGFVPLDGDAPAGG